MLGVGWYKVELFEQHLKLHEGPIYKELRQEGGLWLARSHINYHWYDLISPAVSLEELDWQKVRQTVEEWKNAKVNFAFYINQTDQVEFEQHLNELGLKHNGGDAHMLRDLESSPLGEPPTEILGFELKTVTTENFPAYKQLVEEIHGKEVWLAVAGEFAEMLFSASQNQDQSNKTRIYLGYMHEKPISYAAAIYSTELNIAYLTNSGVHPEYRRRGIHTQMVYGRTKKAVELGISQIYVITGQESDSWHSIQKQGYNEMARYEYYLPD